MKTCPRCQGQLPDPTDAVETRPRCNCHDPEEPDFTDPENEPHRCEECGGEGFIEYNDAGPSYWGEDCPSEENHLVTCRSCNGTGVCIP